VARWVERAVIVGFSVGEGVPVNSNGTMVGFCGDGVPPKRPVFKSPFILNVSFHFAELTGIITIVTKEMNTKPIKEITFRLSTKCLNTSTFADS
jgi:hypothetical protein